METKFKTAYNSRPSKGEVNKLPSETVPNQSMSVLEIMNRFAKGIKPDGKTVDPAYYGEDMVMDRAEWNRLDLEEQRQIIIAARSRTTDILNRLRRKNQMINEKEQEKLFNDRLETEIKLRTKDKQRTEIIQVEPE